MKRQVHKLITHILPLLAFVLVGACLDTDSLIANAEQGDAEAQFQLGSLYYRGEGVVLDYNEAPLLEAVKWWRKAAEQGHAKAQNNLGAMYYNGEGVPQDGKEAAARRENRARLRVEKGGGLWFKQRRVRAARCIQFAVRRWFYRRSEAEQRGLGQSSLRCDVRRESVPARGPVHLHGLIHLLRAVRRERVRRGRHLVRRLSAGHAA